MAIENSEQDQCSDVAMPTDARQVYDLPESIISISLRSPTSSTAGGCFRHVRESPRIRAAKPRNSTLTARF